MIGLPIGRTD